MNTMLKYLVAICFVCQSLVTVAQDVSPAPGSIAGSAEGLYGGTLNAGMATFLLVESGTYFLIVIGKNPDGSENFNIVHGTGNASNGVFASNNAKLLSKQISTYDLQATYVTKSMLTGTLTPQGEPTPLSFSMSYDNRFDIPYPIIRVAGSYTGTIRIGQVALEGARANINHNGDFVLFSNSCYISGTVAQYSAEKNPYEIVIDYVGEDCPFGDRKGAGVMVILPNPVQQSSLTVGITAANQSRDNFVHIVLTKDVPAGQ